MANTMFKGKCNGRQRMSTFVLFLLGSGIAFATFIVLLSCAMSDDSFGQIHSFGNQDNDNKLRPLPAGTKSDRIGKHGQYSQRLPSVVSSTKKLHASVDPKEKMTVKPRGLNNFRNVIIPKTREKGRKPGWMAKPFGEGVEPQSIVAATPSKQSTPSTDFHHQNAEYIY